MSSKEVRIFTRQHDPYSARACTLLRMKGVVFREIHLPEGELELRHILNQAEGTLIVPTIVVHGQIIEGFDRLGSMELRGELDTLLHRNT